MKYVLFRCNDRPYQVEKAVELAKRAKVDLIAFYPGGAPPLQRSLRIIYHPYFRGMKARADGSFIFNLNGVPDHLQSP